MKKNRMTPGVLKTMFLERIEQLGYLAGRPGNKENLQADAALLADILRLANKNPKFQRRVVRFFGAFMMDFILANDRRQIVEPLFGSLDVMRIAFEKLGAEARKRLRKTKVMA